MIYTIQKKKYFAKFEMQYYNCKCTLKAGSTRSEMPAFSKWGSTNSAMPEVAMATLMPLGLHDNRKQKAQMTKETRWQSLKERDSSIDKAPCERIWKRQNAEKPADATRPKEPAGNEGLE